MEVESLAVRNSIRPSTVRGDTVAHQGGSLVVVPGDHFTKTSITKVSFTKMSGYPISHVVKSKPILHFKINVDL